MASAFARFLAGIGHQVVTTASAEWFDVAPRFFLNVPFHRVRAPEPDELAELMREGGALGARCTAPLTGPECLSDQIVCHEQPYELERLSANTRSKVRRGLRRCRVERVDCARVAAHGRQAHVDSRRISCGGVPAGVTRNPACRKLAGIIDFMRDMPSTSVSSTGAAAVH